MRRARVVSGGSCVRLRAERAKRSWLLGEETLGERKGSDTVNAAAAKAEGGTE